MFGLLGLAQAGSPLILEKSATPEDIVSSVFGDVAFAPAIMRAPNGKAPVDATFARISRLDEVLPAGPKVWIPGEAWAKAFLAVWDSNRVEDLFGGGKLVVGSWWTAGGEAEGLEALFELYRGAYPDVIIVNATVAGGQVLSSRLRSSPASLPMTPRRLPTPRRVGGGGLQPRDLPAAAR